MPKTDWDFNEFKKNFYQQTGLNLECYKDQQMERRIRHLIGREKCEGFYDFYNRLIKDSDFMHRFMNYITINTSGFFRDVKVYEELQNEVLPQLNRKFKGLQVWSAGCSNGEEPYTIAIILAELGALRRSHILATDFDDKALANAADGVYNYRQLDKVPPRILEEYFDELGNGDYRIKDKYKKNITFRKQNLLDLSIKEMNKMQLILCRNVFIYFKTSVQEEIISKFTELLEPGGYFVIGCAEYINDPQNFNLTRKSPAIYQKLD